MKILFYLFTLFFLNIFWAQDGVSTKSKKKKKQKQETGWNYNGGFEIFEVVEQETAPGMVFIEGGGVRVPQPNDLSYSTNDSLILKRDYKGNRFTVSSFYISENEVTNKEYREFVDWVKVRSAMDLLAIHYPSKRLSNGNYNEEIPVDWNDPILLKYFYQKESGNKGTFRINTQELYFNYEITQNDSLRTIDKIKTAIYPDTLCWLREYDLKNKIGTINYFSDVKYNDYPVVGVTWHQAKAYCQWRSDRLYEQILLRERKLKRKSYYFTKESYLKPDDKLVNGLKVRKDDGILLLDFRLPTAAEWEYAAVYSDELNYYPWGSNELRDKKGKYQANFGRILDQNGLIIKTHAEDGFLFTAPVGSFNPNQIGLNDMAGNVSEWVLDFYSLNKDYLFQDLDSNTAFRVAYRFLRYSQYIDSTKQFYRDLVKEYINKRIKFEKIYYNNSPGKIVKGGSWADGPLYLMPGIDTFYKADASSGRIGFRVAMDNAGGQSRRNCKRKNKRFH